MIKRIITALIIIACIIPPLLFGGILLYALFAIVVFIGGFELFQLLPNYRNTPKLLYFILLGICFGALFLPDKYIFISLGVIIFMILSLPIFIKVLTSEDVFMICTIYMLVYLFASAFIHVYDVDVLYVWFIIIATYACDTGAYFAGYFFGKHKLCVRISPKKTIEGSIGGIILSIILSLAFYCFVFRSAPLNIMLIGSFVLPIVSQIGDLTFSAIKRNYRIKDFSNVFPGHGGFMDRIDSFVYNLVIFSALMVVLL